MTLDQFRIITNGLLGEAVIDIRVSDGGEDIHAVEITYSIDEPDPPLITLVPYGSLAASISTDKLFHDVPPPDLQYHVQNRDGMTLRSFEGFVDAKKFAQGFHINNRETLRIIDTKTKQTLKVYEE